MDEKMKEALKGIYDNLSDELKEKAKACKTMDELMEFAGKEGIELPDEMLDSVAGGCGVPSDGIPAPAPTPTPVPVSGGYGVASDGISAPAPAPAPAPVTKLIQ